MRDDDLWSLGLAVLGGVGTAVGVFSTEYTLHFSGLGLFLFVLIAAGKMSSETEDIKFQIQRLNEKLQIHKELIDLKAEIKAMKLNKKGSSSLKFAISIAQIVIILIMAYLIIKSFAS